MNLLINYYNLGKQDILSVFVILSTPKKITLQICVKLSLFVLWAHVLRKPQSQF